VCLKIQFSGNEKKEIRKAIKSVEVVGGRYPETFSKALFVGYGEGIGIGDVQAKESCHLEADCHCMLIFKGNLSSGERIWSFEIS
jgi:hypothetical protein